MQCKKCETDIPSTFEYVIAQNVCPKCGSKLMPAQAMAVFLDLKKRLNELEFALDKGAICEKVAMFVVSNYEVIPLNASTPNSVKANSTSPPQPMPSMEEMEAALDGDSVNFSAEEIRAQEAERATELATAREMGFDIDEESFVTAGIDKNKVDRLKRLAAANARGQFTVSRVGDD